MKRNVIFYMEKTFENWLLFNVIDSPRGFFFCYWFCHIFHVSLILMSNLKGNHNLLLLCGSGSLRCVCMWASCPWHGDPTRERKACFLQKNIYPESLLLADHRSIQEKNLRFVQLRMSKFYEEITALEKMYH